ncbi:MAG: hypothetical protein IPK76_26025 [Lewinellaceae bacterium]|nr:hypothetical protein [Lewinellaceae bacterium]
MEQNQKKSRTILYGVVILGAVALALFFIADRWFPQLVSKFTALIISLFVLLGGFFFKKKR